MREALLVTAVSFPRSRILLAVLLAVTAWQLRAAAHVGSPDIFVGDR